MLKSAFDRIAAAVGLALLSPALAAVAAAVFRDGGWPVLFRHARVGRGGRRLQVLKFRTMRQDCGGSPLTTASDKRVTRTGRILRRYKIDELPQLWNVLRGEMSLVGPRPEVSRYVDRSAPWRTVLSAKPGMTDLASLAYRHEEETLAQARDPENYYRETVLPAKLELNLLYIRQQSFWLDARIILVTVVYALLPRLLNAGDVDRLFSAWMGGQSTTPQRRTAAPRFEEKRI